MRKSLQSNGGTRGDFKAITFDFWRTLFRDDFGKERRQIRIDAAIRITGRSQEELDAFMDRVQKFFSAMHINEQRTLSAGDAVRMLEADFGTTLATADAHELSDAFANAILIRPPSVIDGARDAVRAAAERYPVGLISDAGISPGRALRVLLEHAGIAPYMERRP